MCVNIYQNPGYTTDTFNIKQALKTIGVQF